MEGSTANFTCTVKACSDCRVLWRILDCETGHTGFNSSSERRDKGNETIGVFHMEAVNTSVIQCERYNPTSGKRHYSKFALLHVRQRLVSTSIATQARVTTPTPTPISSSQAVVESVGYSDFKMNTAGIYAVLLSSFLTLCL